MKDVNLIVKLNKYGKNDECKVLANFF